MFARALIEKIIAPVGIDARQANRIDVASELVLSGPFLLALIIGSMRHFPRNVHHTLVSVCGRFQHLEPLRQSLHLGQDECFRTPAYGPYLGCFTRRQSLPNQRCAPPRFRDFREIGELDDFLLFPNVARLLGPLKSIPVVVRHTRRLLIAPRATNVERIASGSARGRKTRGWPRSSSRSKVSRGQLGFVLSTERRSSPTDPKLNDRYHRPIDSPSRS